MWVEGSGPPAATAVAGNVISTPQAAGGGARRCLAERLQAVQDREFEGWRRQTATAALPPYRRFEYNSCVG